jgi:hypothetical protein
MSSPDHTPSRAAPDDPQRLRKLFANAAKERGYDFTSEA